MTTPIPTFRKPPVVETVVGVQFAEIEKWTLAHLGVYWNSIRDDFPVFKTQPPLSSQIETFDSKPKQSAKIQIGAMPPDVRGWCISEDDRTLVQVQQNRFLFNWRKGDSGADYPRYEDFIRPEFESRFQGFRQFVEAEGMEIPPVRQCEVSYFNQIAKGEGWTADSDWADLFTFMSADPYEFLPPPRDMQINLGYHLPHQRGRLHVTLGHAIRQLDGAEVIAFNLIARGKPADVSIEGIRDFLDECREWIVRGFTDLTTTKLHKIWEREQ